MTMSLAELIREDLGEGFPVSTGNGKQDDPLVITELLDYVSVEYTVATHVLTMLREEFELEGQSLTRANGRAIDELVYAVKSPGESEWTGRRRFYFDITDGFSSR